MSAENRGSWNIASHLVRMAARAPQQIAVIEQASGTTATFAALDLLSNRLANGLRAVGVTPGMRVLLMLQPGLRFTATVFALFKMGALPVLIDAGMGLRRMLLCIRQVRPEALLGIPKAHLLRLASRHAFGSVVHCVTAGRRWLWGGASLERLIARSSPEFEIPETAADQPAAILFTSGSTGPAKGVVYEHGMFAAQVRSIRAHYQMEVGEIELATFPLFALFCPGLGMTCVFPDMDFSRPGRVDPLRIVAAVRDHAPTNAFGSPALWDRVGRYCARHQVLLASLRRVLIAGAPVDWRILQRLRGCLSDSAEIYTPYGATESLPVASVGAREILADCAPRTRRGAGICVGRPLAERDVRIVPLSDEAVPNWSPDLALPDGDQGEIVVAGAMVTREYFERPQDTANAKIPNGTRLWHRMGDVGYFDEQGRLWFCGRKSQRVRTASGTLFTECCEAIFNEHPEVARSALIGLGDPPDQEPAIVVQLRRRCRTAPDTVRADLLARARQNPMTCGIRRVLFHRRFPVDVRHNAKIDRGALAAWAARRRR